MSEQRNPGAAATARGAPDSVVCDDGPENNSTLVDPQHERPVDLWAEWTDAVDDRSAKGFDWLVMQGVQRRTLFVGPAFTGEARICTYADGTYAPDDRGERAFIMPICQHYDSLDDDFDVDDLAAWRPAQPARIWLRCGYFPVLNWMAVEKARILCEPLYVHGTMLDWLRADCEGVVVLDWSGAHFWLSGAPEIRVDTDWLAARLDRCFRRATAAPRIMVRERAA